MDFIVDGLATGRMVRILSVVDAYTRECLALEADTSLGSGRVTRVLERLIEERGRPEIMRADRGGLVRDTEDKLAWCADGVERENDFVDRVAPSLKLDVKINPEKETNPYAPDLLVNGKVSDLKSQTTPFSTAKRAFRTPKRPEGIDPQYAVSFNRKDYLRYKEHYPDLDIYFWVEWQGLEGYGTRGRPLVGVYKVAFAQLAARIEADDTKLHQYSRRIRRLIHLIFKHHGTRSSARMSCEILVNSPSAPSNLPVTCTASKARHGLLQYC